MSTMVKKSDFYFGAFEFQLTNKLLKPIMIIDRSESSRTIHLETNQGRYNVFIKYSSKPRSATPTTRRWDFSCAAKELEKIDSIANYEGKNLVALVCSEPPLTNTEIAVLDIDKAKTCLGNDSMNKTRRISVSANKGSHHLCCYGTAVSDRNALKTSRNLDKHFA